MNLVMMGTGSFAEPTFRKLLSKPDVRVVGLVTQPDKPTGRPGGSTRQTGTGLTQLARAAQVPVLQPEQMNHPEAVAALAALQPDLLVVAAYGQILKPAVIDLPRHGAINVHASLLPKYRGASPVARAIQQGEVETGVTIIRIRPGLDAGEMLAKVATPIGLHETTGELEARLADLGAELASEVVQAFFAGQAPQGEPQDPMQVTRAPKFQKTDGEIDWHAPALRIQAHIRAMQPWPTPYTYWQRPGKPPVRMLILKSEALSGYGEPGLVAPGLIVGTGRGRLRILELQPAGKKRMPAEEFLKGNLIPPGTRFIREPGPSS